MYNSEKKMRGGVGKGRGLTDLMFSWSLDDILNDSLYSNQVERIPNKFESVPHYFGSYIFPLLEETRAELASSLETISGAPCAEVTSISESTHKGTFVYNISVDSWRNRFSDRGKEPYQTLPGDVFIISDSKPTAVSDLKRVGCTWTFASVTQIKDDETDTEYLVTGKHKDIKKSLENDISATHFKVKPANNIDVKEERQKSFYVIFLINITTGKRIWDSLHLFQNLNIIDKVIFPDYEVVAEDLQMCCLQRKIQSAEVGKNLLCELNESQSEAIMAVLCKLKCDHKPIIELIWGPPGTGKTKTISVLLFILLQMNIRTLVCAPTNIAVNEVASRVLKLVRESENDALFCNIGDILLFGNRRRLKVNPVTEDIYLDNRVDELTDSLGPLGWRHCVITMIDFLENCASQYDVYVENETMKEKEDSQQDNAHMKRKKERRNEKQNKITSRDEFVKVERKSFLKFAKDRFKLTVSPLKRCMLILCTHIPTSYFPDENLENIESLLLHFDYLEKLFNDALESEELEETFTRPVLSEDVSDTLLDTSSLLYARSKCISVLKKLRDSLQSINFPKYLDRGAMKDFCYQNASLILCTANSSFNLHFVTMKPMNLLVIDEAAQLKECESSIPLQLPGLSHVILVGDECQLPAMVSSKVSSESGFGKSLFERLSMLGHPKHLLDVQYRMHPSISFFPNSKFYSNRIQDAPLVQEKSYEIKYLNGKMFAPYCFLNVIDGKEEMDDYNHSRRNMVEVALVVKLIHNLFKVWDGSRKLSVGVISPYAAQVVAIQDRIGRKYEKIEGLTVKVKSVDGFQGGEEDIIIISTVRSNQNGAIGFLASPQRTNVALTRARHCLLILGNEKTLVRSKSIWKELILDAKDRECFFNADEDEDLAKTIIHVKKELDQLDDLLNQNSVLFKYAIWKVFFSDNFLKSFAKVSLLQKKAVINLLLKLSNGWRPRNVNVDSDFENSSQILKQFKAGSLYVVCTIDIKKESNYFQVLKAWDLLPLEEIPKLMKRLEGIFAMYSDTYINSCKKKCLEGYNEIPMTWVASANVVQFKDLKTDSLSDESIEGGSQKRRYVENSRASESLKLMKFYSLSPVMVNHLLSDREGEQMDLPFEVTDEQWEIILIPTSTFILGRSGTGKTTILAMKLFQREQLYYEASKEISAERFAISDGESVDEINVENKESKPNADNNERPLRQLFVTVSPKLCHAVKHHVSGLKRFACNEKFSEANTSINMEDTALFDEDLPDSFISVSCNKYPLVITFHKFLMMLDGTVGNSFFERFPGVKEYLSSKTITSRSVAFESFLRTKEVTYDRFSSLYWVHFNSQLKKKLDPSRIFTEIISHIKGGLKDGKVCKGKLRREEYVILSDGKVSTLSEQTREKIYDIFEDYEKLKMERGEFDLSDLVNDLHQRLKSTNFAGDKMDYVYIDEVQDLTMRQIALLKYICGNVEDGFVFAGDTAQTIARGIDFRFQDIRSLFYNEFLMDSNPERHGGNEKGHISPILNLKENFRTHDGVLKLAQSVIDLLCHFFRHFVDILEPEKSLICGEDPILLESDDDENAIVTIFGKGVSENVTGNLVGFGAEQVILVRDDCARKEISSYVGKQALVLTIVECKGLEFQDVLLFNFFGSSPLKNQWRVVYEYMDEHDMLDENSLSYPSFDHGRHNILCSELKQLYVAITRTRQRLWICENSKDLSKPMFDYWKKKSFVQVKKLDDSLAQAMQVASSPEEWKARGIKLFQEDNYEMATMCFERAGDMTWEKWAKASGMKARADRMHVLNPEASRVILLQAAEIFDSIGKADSAAACFFESREYEKAGRIYLDKCGENKLNKAGECFDLAGRYDIAAEVYAKGHYFTECLLVCSRRKLFEKGLQFIQGWKQLDQNDYFISHEGEVLGEIEQSFLERCANHYYELKDIKSMMKLFKVFCTIDSIRTFLKKLNCFDELLLVEVEYGNFAEALKIAQSKGDVPLEAELLGKSGQIKEASILMLWYVLATSFWVSNNRGWPPKHFPDEEHILEKAKSLAIKESNTFFEFVSTEVDIIMHRENNLSQLICNFKASRINQSLRGEVLSVRRILDIHLHKSGLKYEWEDEFSKEYSEKHCEEFFSGNSVTIGTLTFFWSLWNEKIKNLFKYLTLFETEDTNECIVYRDFCLNCFGLRRPMEGVNVNYLLVNPDASWVRDIKEGFLVRKGNLVYLSIQQCLNAMQTYFRLELMNVGLKLLNTLQSLHNISVKESMSSFRQSMPLIHIFEVAKYLLGSTKLLEIERQDVRKLQNFLHTSSVYFEHVFPLDWRITLDENLISLRRSDLSNSILEEIILVNLRYRGTWTFGQIGRVVMILLGSQKLGEELYTMILKKFELVTYWYDFIKKITDSDCSGNSSSIQDSSIFKLFEALQYTYNANWRVKDFISPHCFFYLVDRLLLWESFTKEIFFTNKSSLVEEIISGNSNFKGRTICKVGYDILRRDIVDFVGMLIEEFLFNKSITTQWINNSDINSVKYFPLFLLRFVVSLCLLYLNYGQHFKLLYHLLQRNDITSYLPRDFIGILKRKRGNNYDVTASTIAEAFKEIGDPLIVVSLKGNRPIFPCGEAPFVNLNANLGTDDILRSLFPIKESIISLGQGVKIEDAKPRNNNSQLSINTSSNLTSIAGQNIENRIENKSNIEKNLETREVILNAWDSLTSKGTEDGLTFMLRASEIKVKVENLINLLLATMTDVLGDYTDGVFVDGDKMLEELRQLSSALDVMDGNATVTTEFLGRLVFAKSMLDTVLDILLMKGDTNADDEAMKTTSSDKDGNQRSTEKPGNSDKVIALRSEIDSGTKNRGKTADSQHKAKGKTKSKKAKKGKGGKKK